LGSPNLFFLFCVSVAFCDCRGLVLGEECFGFVLGRLACEATTKSERHRDRKEVAEEEEEEEEEREGKSSEGWCRS
jgi:hypothetical protein